MSRMSRSRERFSADSALSRLEPRTLLSGDVLALPNQSVLADVNGDGKADEVQILRPATAVTPAPVGVVQIALGRGDGTFRPSDRVPFVANTADAIAVGDLDGDGAADVAIAGRSPSSTAAVDGTHVLVFLGDGRGGFKRVTPAASNTGQPVVFTRFVPQVTAVGGLAIQDLDGSGLGDVAVLGALRSNNTSATDPANTTAHPGAVIAWDPTLPTFAPVPPTVIPFAALTSVDRLFAADLDGNGRTDLVAVRAQPLPPSPLAVVRPDLVVIQFPTGRAPVVRHGVNPLNPPPTNAARFTTIGLADVDGDAVPDLVGWGGASTIRYANAVRHSSATAAPFGQAKTALSRNLPATVQFGRVRIGDIDGDALADLLAHGSAGPLWGRNVTPPLSSATSANRVAIFAWRRLLQPVSAGAAVLLDAHSPTTRDRVASDLFA